MKIALLLTLLSSFAQVLPSNDAYRACMDSLNREYVSITNEWNQEIPPHFMAAMRLEKEAEAHPEIRDSLLALAVRERETGQGLVTIYQGKLSRNQNARQELMERHALLFEDAFPYFAMRNQFSKDSLSVLLKSASREIRRSEKGKALHKYIKNQQIAEGMLFRSFRCYDSSGKSFNWNHIKGKKVFLVHDGLWCMNHGMDNSAFRKYLESIAPYCLPLVIVNCANKEELQSTINEYGLQNFYVVSEFKKDLGALNWLYNDSTTPTCHHIDEQGILVRTTEGIKPDYLEKEFLGIN